MAHDVLGLSNSSGRVSERRNVDNMVDGTRKWNEISRNVLRDEMKISISMRNEGRESKRTSLSGVRSFSSGELVDKKSDDEKIDRELMSVLEKKKIMLP